MLKLASKIKRH